MAAAGGQGPRRRPLLEEKSPTGPPEIRKGTPPSQPKEGEEPRGGRGRAGPQLRGEVGHCRVNLRLKDERMTEQDKHQTAMDHLYYLRDVLEQTSVYDADHMGVRTGLS